MLHMLNLNVTKSYKSVCSLHLLLLFFFFFLVLLVGCVHAKEEFVWRDLTPDELKGWYSPTDLCALQNTNYKAFPQDVRAKNCSQYSGGNKRLHCGVGFGANNKPCYGPYGAARPSYKRGVEGYTDFTRKPLTNAFRQLIKTNTTLLIVGDSTMRQKIQAMECQLLREDPRIRVRGDMFGILPCDTTVRIMFPDGKEAMVFAVSLGPNSIKCLKNGLHRKAPADGIFENIESILERIIAPKCETTNGASKDVSSGSSTEKQLLKIKNTVCAGGNTSTDVHTGLSVGRNVLLVANMGLWYNEAMSGGEHGEVRTKSEFERALPTVLSFLSRIASWPNRSNIVAWHESSSQHWKSIDGSGYFDLKLVDNQETEFLFKNPQNIPIADFQIPQCCKAITNTSEEADWRNYLVKKQLQALGLAPTAAQTQKIQYLPYADITRAVGDMHTCHQLYKHDCTHFCYWPLLYQPFWSQIEGLSYLAKYKNLIR